MSVVTLSYPRLARKVASPRWLSIAIAALCAAAFVIRLAAARGDLWLDEIWSFRLVEALPLHSIVFGLPHDNNHLLTSIWMAAVGPDAAPVLVRLPSVVFGALCVPIAARIGCRRHPLAGLFAAAMVAFDAILVHYGSEARGYGGLILASLVAIDSVETFLDHPERRLPLPVMALAVTFGTLSQLTMAATSLVLCATLAIRALSDGRGLRRGPIEAIGAIALGTLPALVCLAISIGAAPLHVGLQTPFTWRTLADGMARMVEATVGLADKGVDPPVLLALAAIACLAGLAFIEPKRRVLPALAIFGVPALLALLHLPNEQFARFHLVSSIGVLILATDVVARAASFGGTARRVTGLVAALAVAAQAPNLVRLVSEKRGSFRAPVAAMAADGAATFVARPAIIAAETRAVVRWYAEKSGAAVTPEGSDCPARARWLLVAREPGDPLAAPDQTIDGAPGCTGRYTLDQAYPAYGLSGFTWLLFRRVGPGPAS